MVCRYPKQKTCGEFFFATPPATQRKFRARLPWHARSPGKHATELFTRPTHPCGRWSCFEACHDHLKTVITKLTGSLAMMCQIKNR